MSGDTPSWTERTLSFGSTRNLVGIHCLPRTVHATSPVVLFLNSGLVHRVGPNRLYVRLARRFATAGIGSIRFDLSGIGDSISDPGASASVLEQVKGDIATAIDLAEKNGATGVVLLGICSGADNGFAAAVRDPRVVGAVLIDPNAYPTWGFYLHYIGKRMRRLRTWLNLVAGPHSIPRRIAALFRRKSPEQQGAANVFLAPTTLPPRETMREQLLQLIARETRLLYIFTGGLQWRYNHKRQLFRAFPDIDWRSLAQLEYYSASDHTFSRAEHQQLLIDRVCDWLQSTQFRTAPATSASPPAEEVLVF